MRMIDAHVHVFPDGLAPKVVKTLEDYYKMTWSCKGTLADLEQTMEQGGVEQCIIFSTPTKPEQVTAVNDFLAQTASDRLIPFGSVHPEYENALMEVDRVKSMGFFGFKFHPDFQHFAIDDEAMLPIYKRIGTQYPILIHVGDETSDRSSPKRMARVLDLLPNHTFIAAHMGGYARWDEAQAYLVGKNIFFDTSSSLCRLSPQRMKEMIRAHGADKILFGTDYPAVDARSESQRILDLGLTEAENDQIFYQNARRILKQHP